MRHAIRHAAAVFATLLVLDVVLCVAWWLGMGVSHRFSDVGMGDLAPLLVAWMMVIVAAVAGVAAGVARAVVKPELKEGAAPSVDLLARPAVAAALASLVGMGLVWRGEGAGEAVQAYLIFFVLALVALALVALVVRRVSPRALVVAAGVVVGVALVALVIADRRGRARLEQYRAEALREVATLRQQQAAAVRPVLQEPATDADAVATYQRLLATQRDFLMNDKSTLVADLSTALAAPAAPPPASVTSAVERFRGDIEALAEATRARRAVWPIEYEKSFAAEIPHLQGVRVLAQLAIVDGNARANAGDAAGAAERYLQVLRFGSDFGDGPLIQALIGSAVERMAAEALARLVRSPLGAPVRDRVDEGLARLQPALIAVGPAWRSERLLFAAMGPVDDSEQFAQAVASLGERVPLLPRLAPWNAYAAPAVEEMNRTMKDMEAVAAREDPRAWRKTEEEFLPRYYFATTNFVYRAAVPSLLRAREGVDSARTLVAAVRAAIGLERRFSAEGRYPDVPDTLPMDLASSDGAALRYRVGDGGASYTLYSVGVDRKDDGGKAPNDTVLPEAAWPQAPAAAATNARKK